MTVSSIHRLPGLDPWSHLAREELLLEDLPPEQSALVLYVNSPCVVVGKHQNPLREVRLAETERRKIPVVRRISGGGTVYHDEGNLNWSWLGPRATYDREAVSQAVADALVPLGLEVVLGEKGDLLSDGKKVSGAAYLFRRDRVLHHGTLLCQARLDDLRGVLGSTGEFLEMVGVASRPSPVKNLGVTVTQASEALVKAFSEAGTLVGDGMGTEDFERRVAACAAERASEVWLWNHTPPFTWHGPTRWGSATVRVRDGLVEQYRDDRTGILSNMVGKQFFGEVL